MALERNLCKQKWRKQKGYEKAGDWITSVYVCICTVILRICELWRVDLDGRKNGVKKMKLAGMVLCGLMVMLMVLAGVYDAESADILMSICMILFLPLLCNLANVGKIKKMSGFTSFS